MQHKTRNAGSSRDRRARKPDDPDALRDVRRLKRLVQLGVYTAITADLPIYPLLLGSTLEQTAAIGVIGWVIATCAIELAFAQFFKLRKRSAYPNLLLVGLGDATDVSEAAERSLQTVCRLLKPGAAMIVLKDARGEPLVAASTLTPDRSSDLVLKSRAELELALAGGAICNLRLVAGQGFHPAFGLVPVGLDKLTLVPVMALKQPAGVLLLASRAGNRDVNDESLLTNIAVALGLSLETLRQKEELRQKEQRLRTLVTSAPVIIFATDCDGVLTFLDGKGLEVLTDSPQSFIGRSVFDIYADRPDIMSDFARALAGEDVTTISEIGAAVLESRLSPLRDNRGDVAGIIGVSTDVTTRHRMERALEASEERYRGLFEHARDVIYTITLDGIITSLNPAFEEITGWQREEWIGRHFGPIIHADDLPDVAERMQRLISDGAGDEPPELSEWRVLTKSGDYMVGEFMPTPLYEDSKLVGVLGVARDVTERKKAEGMIRQLAYHDALTGLPNRALFEDRLGVALAQARRHHQMLAVMFLDLDRFKLVNDTLGHTGGDKMLKAVADQLSSMVREGDTVARVGGDEFTLLLPGINVETDAIEVAERILLALRSPRTVDGQEFSVTTSIGITVFPRDGADADTLLRNADTAMYRAKERGRDAYELYSPAMNANIVHRLSLERDLRHAIERDELRVYYQPIADAAGGRIVAMEALLRWDHPDRGILRPDEFVPLAEETGLIVPIGRWVLEQACAQLAGWRRDGVGALRVAVNLAARQLQDEDIVRLVARLLDESRLPADALQLELTEGAVMKNFDAAVTMLQRLREMGTGISIDDFGTGYSSLSYLKRFPIDAVKIDRSFVRDITTDPNDAAIVTTIIAMARNLNLRVIAEGVETQEQLAFLKRRGCDEYQGYLISRPSPAENLKPLLLPGSNGARRRRTARAKSELMVDS